MALVPHFQSEDYRLLSNVVQTSAVVQTCGAATLQVRGFLFPSFFLKKSPIKEALRVRRLSQVATLERL